MPLRILAALGGLVMFVPVLKEEAAIPAHQASMVRDGTGLLASRGMGVVRYGRVINDLRRTEACAILATGAALVV